MLTLGMSIGALAGMMIGTCFISACYEADTERKVTISFVLYVLTYVLLLIILTIKICERFF